MDRNRGFTVWRRGNWWVTAWYRLRTPTARLCTDWGRKTIWVWCWTLSSFPNDSIFLDHTAGFECIKWRDVVFGSNPLISISRRPEMVDKTGIARKMTVDSEFNVIELFQSDRRVQISWMKRFGKNFKLFVVECIVGVLLHQSQSPHSLHYHQAISRSYPGTDSVPKCLKIVHPQTGLPALNIVASIISNRIQSFYLNHSVLHNDHFHLNDHLHSNDDVHSNDYPHSNDDLYLNDFQWCSPFQCCYLQFNDSIQCKGFIPLLLSISFKIIYLFLWSQFQWSSLCSLKVSVGVLLIFESVCFVTLMFLCFCLSFAFTCSAADKMCLDRSQIL